MVSNLDRSLTVLSGLMAVSLLAKAFKLERFPTRQCSKCSATITSGTLCSKCKKPQPMGPPGSVY